MKRLRRSILSSLFVLVCTAVLAQKHIVVSAYNENDDGNYLKALDYIDQALDHEDTKDEPKTWLYRGNIYKNIALEQLKLQKKEKGNRNEERLKKLKEAAQNPILTAIKSYQKCMKLDEKEGEYAPKAQMGLMQLRNPSYNQAIQKFNKEDYEVSFKLFAMATTLGRMTGQGIDSTAFYNMALAAEKAGKVDTAIMLYGKAGQMGVKGPQPFINKAYLQQKTGAEGEAVLKTLQAAREKYPENKTLINMVTNQYLRTKKFEEAKESLELALEKDKENPILYFSLGTVHDQLYKKYKEKKADSSQKKARGQFKKAKKNYKKAIELDSGYFDAYYNLGALHYNEGVEIFQKTQKIKDQAKYKEEIKGAKENFRKALPYLEKAHQLKPDDRTTMNSLKNLYARMKGEEYEKKYKEMKKKLEN